MLDKRDLPSLALRVTKCLSASRSIVLLAPIPESCKRI